MKSLLDAQTGTLNEVKNVKGEDIIVQRLNEIGVIKGASVVVISKIFFGDPYMVKIDGSVFALRKEEVQCIWI